MPKQTKTTYTGAREYLAARPFALGSVTLDASTVTADAAGDKIVQPGTLIAKISASGKWGPYDAGASDGRQTSTDNLLICHDHVNLKGGDMEAAVLLIGVAQAEAVTLVDGTTVITKALQEKLRSKIANIIFDALAAS